MSKEKIRAKWSTELIEPDLPKDYGKYDVIKALAWYNIMTDSKTCAGYVNSYLKKRKILKVITPQNSIQTAAAVARLIDRDQITDSKNLKWMEDWVSQLSDKVIVPKDPNNKFISFAEATANKLNFFLEGLDNAVDDHIFNSDFKMKFSTEKYLANNNVKYGMLKHIDKWASDFRDEIILSKTDKDLKEGYSNFTTPQKNKIIKFLNTIIEGVGIYGVAIKPERVKKIKSPSKIVSKLKYAKSFPELKLKSEDPQGLIGSKEVWVYNTKTKMVGYYTSLDGMTVTGTTLRGFDFSEQRRLRKPEDQLKLLTDSRKGQWIKKFTSMAKTVKTKGNGRFNDATIILKEFK